jgi:hypothetical protein
MWNMLKNTFDFLSEKARGLLLTLTGTGIGTIPEVVKDVQRVSPTLETVQIWAYTASFVVAVLTIISYGYKFILFVRRNCVKKK